MVGLRVVFFLQLLQYYDYKTNLLHFFENHILLNLDTLLDSLILLCPGRKQSLG